MKRASADADADARRLRAPTPGKERADAPREHVALAAAPLRRADGVRNERVPPVLSLVEHDAVRRALQTEHRRAAAAAAAGPTQRVENAAEFTRRHRAAETTHLHSVRRQHRAPVSCERVDREYGYPVPYRCFYSRNVPNLFMAGRCISVTHDALGTVRVMRTCGMMGEVIGRASARVGPSCPTACGRTQPRSPA